MAVHELRTRAHVTAEQAACNGHVPAAPSEHPAAEVLFALAMAGPLTVAALMIAAKAAARAVARNVRKLTNHY